MTNERGLGAAHEYYGDLSYDGLLGVFCVRYALRRIIKAKY
jgi:hypothetical protein